MLIQLIYVLFMYITLIFLKNKIIKLVFMFFYY